MTQDATEQIEEIDSELALLRKSWMEAAPAEKTRWMGMIDKALDARSQAMARRDGKAK
jgi:hypothetical protein